MQVSILLHRIAIFENILVRIVVYILREYDCFARICDTVIDNVFFCSFFFFFC